MTEAYKLFATVVEEGGISAASRVLRLSPPMISKKLSGLERRLGARLIHRTTRRMVLTDVGQDFYERVVHILEATDEAEAMVAGRAGRPSGHLRLTAPTAFGRLYIAPKLNLFLESYPDVALDLTLTDLMLDLIVDRLDLAVRVGSAPAGNLASVKIADNRRVLCAATSYIERYGEPRRIEDLRKHRLLASAWQLPWRLKGPEGQRIVEGKSVVQTNSGEVIYELVLGGVGIALRSLWEVHADLRDGRLKVVMPMYESAADVGIYAVYPHAEHVTPSVRAFIDFLRRLHQPCPPWESVEGDVPLLAVAP